LNISLSLRERARVRGTGLMYSTGLPPHPVFEHLLPQGEGFFKRLVVIR
jgi:hypothetical protein